jgi:hypothetical protein
MDTGKLASGNSEIACGRRAASQYNRVELLTKLVASDVNANVHIAAKLNAFGFELSQTAIKVLLLHFELRNSVTEKATGPVGTFEDHHIVPSACQLLGGSEPRRTRTDDSDRTASPQFRTLWLDPTLGPGSIDDLDFNLLNGYWILIDANYTRSFARRRAEPTSEFRKVIRCVQAIDRVAPSILKHKIVPIGNQITERTPVVAERDAAVHAPAGLFSNLCNRKVFVYLFPVT